MVDEARRIRVSDEGCVGCRMCERSCPVGAMRVEDKRARIDYGLCIACGMCATKCPRHVIHDALGVFASAE